MLVGLVKYESLFERFKLTERLENELFGIYQREWFNSR